MLKEKSCMCFMDLEKALDREPTKVKKWAKRKKGKPGVMIRSVMRMYEEVKENKRGF